MARSSGRRNTRRGPASAARLWAHADLRHAHATHLLASSVHPNIAANASGIRASASPAACGPLRLRSLTLS